ncbi:MAG: YheU family protein [Chitinophagaceae bacterium]|nr:YheU family protein [Oligoflexus sp.]
MQIPIESISPETLKRVVEEFVTREGTDYGVSANDLQTKVEQVLRLLKKGDALLCFDTETESCHIVPKNHPMFRELSRQHKEPRYQVDGNGKDDLSLS